MPSPGASPVVSFVVERDEGEDEGPDDDGPLFAFLPLEDRLWRHPSEMIDAPTAPNPLVHVGQGDTAVATRPVVRVWTLALAAGLAGALFASGFFMATGISDRRTTVLEPVSTPATAALAATSSDASTAAGDWPSIAASLAASIVAVKVSNYSNSQVGSGVLWAVGRDESYVITAQDLVGSSSHVSITFDTGVSQTAEVLGSDPVSGIAVLATAGTHQSFPTFGSVSDVEVAEPVLAVGTQVSSASPVVSGAISGVDDDVTPGSRGGTMDGMLALTGVTVPDTSDGGALVDPAGAVVGIATDITTTDPSAPDVSYAVPIDTAEHVANALLEGNRPTHPWLGVEDATDLVFATAQHLGVAGGAQIGQVDAGSPAARIGLRPNDVITAIGGQPVTSSGGLVRQLSRCEPGQSTAITYYREGRRSSVTVRMAEQPTDL